MKPVYLDHNATTPIAPEVLAAMTEVLREAPGNPNSVHRFGAEARYRIEKARKGLAKLIGVAQSACLVYTSGGTESDNLALRGACFAARRRGAGNHLIVSAAEHKAVLDTAIDLRDRRGFDLTILGVDGAARVDPGALRAALRPDTILVSIIAANNEAGSLNDIKSLAAVAHEHSAALFHTDAVQWIGRAPMNIVDWGADLVSLGAHKVHGPRGIGALYIRHGAQIEPQATGGGQERGIRSGTEDTAAIVGFTEAIRRACGRMAEESARLSSLREQLWKGISRAIPQALRNSPAEGCLPNTLNLSLAGYSSQRLVAELDAAGFAVSAGSACTNGGNVTSHVALAMGIGEERAAGTIRVSLGAANTPQEMDAFAEALAMAVNTLDQKKET